MSTVTAPPPAPARPASPASPAPRLAAPAARPAGAAPASPAPRRRRSRSVDGYAKGRAKREEILQVAITMFGEVGYHSASLREISARVGLSHPGLLHHFPTKVALLEAVLEHRDAVDRDSFDGELGRGGDVFEALVHLAERNMLRRPVVELYAQLAAEATSAHHPAHDYFVRRYQATVATIAGSLRRRAEAGGMRPGTCPEQVARTVVAVMDGLQVQWLLARDLPRAQRLDMAADLRSYLELVLVPAAARAA